MKRSYSVGLTSAAPPITAVSLRTDSTDERAQGVVATSSRETRLRGALVYIFSACTA